MNLRVLIVKPSSLGDVVHGLQVVTTMEHQWRQRGWRVEIDWVIRDTLADFLAQSTVVHRCLIFKRGGGIGAFGELIRQVRKSTYDYVLDMQGLARSAFLVRMARGRRKIGRWDGREGARWWCPSRVEFPPGGKTAHALDILKKFLPAVGLEETELRSLSFRDEGPVLAVPCPYFLLFPHSRQPEKEWPHFLSLTKCLLEHTSVVWAGDREISVAFKHPRFFNLMGQTRLSELPGLVKNACGVVANDSGPMHLAAALGKRLVALFGPTSPERFGPYPAGSPLFSVLKSEDGKMDSLNPQTVRDTVLRMGGFTQRLIPSRNPFSPICTILV